MSFNLWIHLLELFFVLGIALVVIYIRVQAAAADSVETNQKKDLK